MKPSAINLVNLQLFMWEIKSFFGLKLCFKIQLLSKQQNAMNCIWKATEACKQKSSFNLKSELNENSVTENRTFNAENGTSETGNQSFNTGNGHFNTENGSFNTGNSFKPFPSQEKNAEEIVSIIRDKIGIENLKKFKYFDVFFFVPLYLSLYDQTVKRVSSFLDHCQVRTDNFI